MPREFHLADFDYALPDELIAQFPLAERTASRLLSVGQDAVHHGQFADIRHHLRSGDLLVVNDTKVLKARLRARKDSGGAAEILVERILADREALCQVRVSKPLRPGRTLEVEDGGRVVCVERRGEFYRLAFPERVIAFLSRHGRVPLPPYIDRDDESVDELRYQTVYGTRPGAVAAPTAGLHFSAELVSEIEGMGVEIARVTLHVGAGTFQPVRHDDLKDHRMHDEWYEVSEHAAQCLARTRANGASVVAVGTTVVRALESAAMRNVEQMQGSGETNLFITPGFHFRVVDKLVTNFHLPKSTLLMLVCAFAGHERVMTAYREAVAGRYRFFSYGDAMFLERRSV